MSYHIVSIHSPQCVLSCRDGQLTCQTADGERKLPLEDIAAILITSFAAQIHSELLLAAARHGVALILCEAFKPASLVLPANRSTDTTLSRALVRLSPGARRQLWERTLDAKCRNQHALAARIAPADPQTAALARAARSRRPHREAAGAKAFWRVFGRALGEPRFTRARGGGGLNDLLNYGYAVLLSTVLQKLFAVGLDPTFGVSHLPRERCTPLAYDLMEPFRPCVDGRVFQWAREHPRRADWTVSPEYRKWAARLPLEPVPYRGGSLAIQNCVEAVVRGFRRAVLAGRPALYHPWTPGNSRWDG